MTSCIRRFFFALEHCELRFSIVARVYLEMDMLIDCRGRHTRSHNALRLDPKDYQYLRRRLTTLSRYSKPNFRLRLVNF